MIVKQINLFLAQAVVNKKFRQMNSTWEVEFIFLLPASISQVALGKEMEI